LNIGGLFDGRAWSHASEAARVGVAPLLALVVLSGPLAWLVGGLFGLGVVSFALRLLGLRDFYAGSETAAMSVESI
jgi:hypothetical protein